MDQPHPCRRLILEAGALTLLTAPVVAACGGSGPSPTATTAADGSLRIPTSQVPLGQTVFDRDHTLILSHPADDEYVVFDATCPHQGCAVSTVQDDLLVCPCHGSTFDPATGELVKGPATTGLTVKESTVADEEIVIRG